MITLPSWANSPRGYALLAEIERDPPHMMVGDAMGFGVRYYAGKKAQELRDMFDDQLAALIGAETAAWKAGIPCPDIAAQSTALLMGERPDALIARLLAEGESLAPVEQLPNGGVIA